MLFSSPGPGILVAHERYSRITIAVAQMHLRADNVASSLLTILEPLPPDQRQSITFDNGTEFYRHQRLTSQLGITTYFCDPRAPWQKGSVENAIGRLRRALPTKTDLAALPQARLNAIIANYNNTPRKCLAFQTAPAISQTAKFLALSFNCFDTTFFSASGSFCGSLRDSNLLPRYLHNRLPRTQTEGQWRTY